MDDKFNKKYECINVPDTELCVRLKLSDIDGDKGVAIIVFREGTDASVESALMYQVITDLKKGK